MEKARELAALVSRPQSGGHLHAAQPEGCLLDARSTAASNVFEGLSMTQPITSRSTA